MEDYGDRSISDNKSKEQEKELVSLEDYSDKNPQSNNDKKKFMTYEELRKLGEMTISGWVKLLLINRKQQIRRGMLKEKV